MAIIVDAWTEVRRSGIDAVRGKCNVLQIMVLDVSLCPLKDDFAERSRGAGDVNLHLVT